MHLIRETYKPIIDEVDKNILLSELDDNYKVKLTNKGNNIVYDIKGDNSPNIMNEIGRLREITFRKAGGGTGKSIDVDKFDFGDDAYQQLIVWNPTEDEIIGGYRYKLCNQPKVKSEISKLATASYFHFSEKFNQEYLPYTIELGRSFIQPKYQKTIYALDNIWDGLGALISKNPKYKYFFGKVTMYPTYNLNAKKILLGFIKKYFGDKEELIFPKESFKVIDDLSMEQINHIFYKDTFNENYKILKNKIKELGETIPPLVNSYMRLTNSMISFGTIINNTFGQVEETGLLMPIEKMNKEKIKRHLQ